MVVMRTPQCGAALPPPERADRGLRFVRPWWSFQPSNFPGTMSSTRGDWRMRRHTLEVRLVTLLLAGFALVALAASVWADGTLKVSAVRHKYEGTTRVPGPSNFDFN